MYFILLFSISFQSMIFVSFSALLKIPQKTSEMDIVGFTYLLSCLKFD